MDKETKQNTLIEEESPEEIVTPSEPIEIEEASPIEDEVLEEVDEKTKRIREIDIQMQELDVQIEQISFIDPEDADRDRYVEQYKELKDALKALAQERRQLLKNAKDTVWEKIPLWMIGYAIVQIILCFPFLSSFIWVNFANGIISLFESTLDQVATGAPHAVFIAVLILVIYSLPIVNILLTWLIYVNVVKKEFDKKVFKWIWIGQGILTIGMMIWLFIDVIYKIL